MQLKTLLLTILLSVCTLQTDDFRFSRYRRCNNIDPKGRCKAWNDTVVLYRQTPFWSYCFPGDSYVLTTDGPKQMRDLKFGDQLFGMNLETGKNEYSQVTAWLHRDTESLLKYSLIQVQNQPWKFISSDYHNIGFSTDDQADFKFLKDLNVNDTLISLTSTGEDFRVSNIDQKVQKQGLYSPLTKTSTFYIFPDSFTVDRFESKQGQSEDFPMILVHCLSQVNNPTKNQHMVSSYVKLSHALFGSHQPADDEEYVNPLLSTFNGVFGRDWVKVQGEKIAHKFSPTHSSSAGSTVAQQRQQERKKKTMAVVALQTMMSDILV